MSFALCCRRGGGHFENGVTARIGRGTGSQESRVLDFFISFLLLALRIGCESFSPQPEIPRSNTSWSVLSTEVPYRVFVGVSVMSL